MTRMTKQEILEDLEQNDTLCDYCQHGNICIGSVEDYGREPLHVLLSCPPCVNTDYELLIDFKKYVEDYGIELV